MAKQDDSSPTEFNPRWKGYLYITITSLVNFASISNLEIKENPQFQGHFQVSLVFGVTTFALTVAILVMDRFQYCCSKDNAEKYNYTKAMDGKIEGYTLLGFTFWWIVGVAHITQVDGVGYVANNIYFSSWLTLFACVYTLDKWSAAKDILSIRELTGVSATLKSWYVLFLSSLVTMGTCCDLTMQLAPAKKSSAAYGIALGLASTMVALFFIFVHYRFIDYEFLQVGGWIELSASFFMILLWIVGVAILTAEGGIAATIGGSGCTSRATVKYDIDFDSECYVLFIPEAQQQKEDDSGDEPPPDEQGEEASAQPSELPQSTTLPQPSARPSVAPSVAPSIRATPTATTTYPTLDNATEAPTTLNTSSPTSVEVVETAPPTITETSAVSYEELDDDLNATANTMDPSDTGTEGFSLEPTMLIPVEEDEEQEDDQIISLLEDMVLDGNITSNTTDAGNFTNTTMLDDELFLLNETNTSDASFLFDDTVEDLEDDNNTNQRALQQLRSAYSIVNASQRIKNETNATVVPTSPPTRAHLFTHIPTMVPSQQDLRQSVACGDIIDAQIPGSNLYLACWICFFASFNITLRWKAAQAIQFAQAQHRKSSERARRTLDSEKDDDEGDDDDDDDDDAETSFRGDDGL